MAARERRARRGRRAATRFRAAEASTESHLRNLRDGVPVVSSTRRATGSATRASSRSAPGVEIRRRRVDLHGARRGRGHRRASPRSSRWSGIAVSGLWRREACGCGGVRPVLALGLQTDVIGIHWLAFTVWSRGLALGLVRTGGASIRHEGRVLRHRPSIPGVGIGHVHLKVADLERGRSASTAACSASRSRRATAIRRSSSPRAATTTTSGSTPGSRRAVTPPAARAHRPLPRGDPLPDRDARGRAAPARRGGVPLDGASDHGVSEALYLRDPDGNGVELYWDRPKEEWPRNADGVARDVHAARSTCRRCSPKPE